MSNTAVETKANPGRVLVINRHFAELAAAAAAAFSEGQLRVVVDRRNGQRQLDADGLAEDDLSDLFLEV